MTNIGLIVAVEMEALINKYGDATNVHNFKHFIIFEYRINNKNLYVMKSGAGLIAATMATQFLISNFNIDLIVNFGVVGSVRDSINVGDTCIVESVVHYNFDVSDANKNYKKGMYFNNDYNIPTTKKYVSLALEKKPLLKKVVCGSADKFVGTENEKRKLAAEYNIDIIDMEAVGVVLTCISNDIHCFIIKTVSDGVKAGVEEFNSFFNKSSNICIDFLDDLLF